MKRRLSILACGLLSLSLCVGSMTVLASESGRSEDSNIVVALSTDIVTLDPADTTNTLDGGIQRLIMDGLFGFDENMKVINMLATGYEANEDATEYVITLRQGVSFTDGTPWDAAAAKANLDRLSDQSLGLKRNGLFNMIDSTEIVDDYTIKVKLKYSFGAFINTLAHPAGVMMSPKQIEAGAEVCAQQPVGTGQYIFEEWKVGQSITLKLNEDWWGYKSELFEDGLALVEEDAGFNTVLFQPVPEAATRISMLQAGDADMIFPVPTESYSVLEADPNVTAESSEGITVNYIHINTHKDGVSDVRVRKAISMAVNKAVYCQVVKNGLASPATSHMGPSVQFYEEQPEVTYDVDAAKALMEEAGYGDGLSLTCVTQNSSEAIKAGEFMQQQLSLIGIELKIVPTEQGTISETINSFKGAPEDACYDLYLRGWSPSTGDADWVLRALWGSEMVPPNGSNYAYLMDETYDQLMLDGLSSADYDVRATAYSEAQKYLWDNMICVPIANSFNTWAYGSHIENVGIYPDGALYLRDGSYVE